MRLIASFNSERQAVNFSDFLFRNKISNQYEKEVGKEPTSYSLWVHNEEDLSTAFDYYQSYILQPEHPRFLPKQKVEAPSENPPKVKKQTKSKSVQRNASFLLTYSMIAICIIIFIWNSREESALRSYAKKGSFASEFMLTPLQENLFFDAPRAIIAMQDFIEENSISSLKELREQPEKVQREFREIDSLPMWNGLFFLAIERIQEGWYETPGPLFEKIREGQVWRFVTPIFMHRDFLHIFFNMAWLLILGKQIELRLKKRKMLLLILLLAVFSNTAQYLMSGPLFLGFSGVITGFAGFIWSRQKKAPWEAYPLHRATALFLFYFVLILFFISIVCFILKAFTQADFASAMANTAHISGGLLGLALGRCSFFARRLS
jgi:GlpG protein